MGDVVLLKEEKLPRGSWPLCIVEETYVSKDQNVRSVKLRVGDQSLNKAGKRVKAVSYLQRPIHKLIVVVSKAEQD